MRLIDSCITQLKAQGPSRTCPESKEEEEEQRCGVGFRVWDIFQTYGLGVGDILRVGRGTARAEDAQGTPTQSHISPSILVYEDNATLFFAAKARGFTANLGCQLENSRSSRLKQS